VQLEFKPTTASSEIATFTKASVQTVSSAGDAVYPASASACMEENEHTVTEASPIPVTATEENYPTKSRLNPAATHFVQVGVHNQTLFRPNQLDAAVGDVIVFKFHGFNHTLSESTLEDPCKGSGAFDTGFNQAFSNDTIKPVVAFSVDDPAPRWFFCRQDTKRSHCHDGMVFGLNPGEKMDAFLYNARNQVISELPINNTSVGRLPTGPLILPSRMISKGAGRQYMRRAGSLWSVIGVAGIRAL
jgi:plastocyanin